MAYAKEIQTLCSRCYKRRATHEVFNRRNSSLGLHCKSCAVARMKALKLDEDLEDKSKV